MVVNEEHRVVDLTEAQWFGKLAQLSSRPGEVPLKKGESFSKLQELNAMAKQPRQSSSQESQSANKEKSK